MIDAFGSGGGLLIFREIAVMKRPAICKSKVANTRSYFYLMCSTFQHSASAARHRAPTRGVPQLYNSDFLEIFRTAR